MYEEFYNLSAKPFRLTPDHQFFFNSTVHGRAMSYLQYGMEQGEGFVVITGSVGTGKTMLVRNLFQELDEQRVTAAQLVTTRVEPDDMLRMVCASFGLDHEGLGKASLLHHLEAFARGRSTEGKRVLLVVDEAHNLPASSLEELRMLSNFQVDGHSQFQSFLLGQEELKQTLQQSGMEQIRQRIIASYHLQPLVMEEVRDYVEFRLGQVGWQGDPAFEDGIHRELYRYSRGVPRLINTLCDRLLLHGSMEQLHSLNSEALQLVVQEMNSEEGGVRWPAAQELASMPAAEVEQKAAEPRQPEQTPETKETELDASTAAPTESEASVKSESLPAPQNPQDLAQRVEALEQEVIKLKKAMHHDRKLLRKAVLFQLEMGGDDDLD